MKCYSHNMVCMLPQKPEAIAFWVIGIYVESLYAIALLFLLKNYYIIFIYFSIFVFPYIMIWTAIIWIRAYRLEMKVWKDYWNSLSPSYRESIEKREEEERRSRMNPYDIRDHLKCAMNQSNFDPQSFYGHLEKRRCFVSTNT